MTQGDLSEAATACPRLTVRVHARVDGGQSLEVLVGHHPDDELRGQLASLFSHPAIATYRHVSFSASGPTMPDTDFRWVLDAIATVRPAGFDRLFVSSARIMTFDGVARLCADGARLGSANWATHYRGNFPAIRTLDLRDALLSWHDCVWPDLESLALSPRHAERGLTWARSVLAASGSFPRLREVRFPENYGDELVAALLESALLPQLRRVDVTDNITDRGAQLLHDHADRVAHLDELWIGSTGHRRRYFEHMHRETEYPRGTLEVGNAWASRLRARLGSMLRFKQRRGHPDL
ncbi:MAG: hypothetical protein HOV81_05340 [Kofleriaceae bacterium]|nr:hypothetical protein [Kofleriaceae bacterium]